MIGIDENLDELSLLSIRLRRILNIFFVELVSFFKSIYEYREYLIQAVARDLRKKYKRSSLGYIWSMLQPMLMMIILTLVFSNIMRQNIENYSVFLFVGLLPWEYFSSTVHASFHSISGNIPIISQVPVPKYIFILTSAASNLVNFFLSLIPLMLVMLVVGHSFSFTILLLPIVLIPLFLFTMGLSLMVAVSNVFFDDTQHLVTVLLRALYFLCPILYGRKLLPDWLVKYLIINPMFGVIESMRSIIYDGEIFSLSNYFIALAGGILVLTFGLVIFKRSDNKFIYFV